MLCDTVSVAPSKPLSGCGINNSLVSLFHVLTLALCVRVSVTISSLTFSFVGSLLRFHWSWRLRVSSCKRYIRTSFRSLWRQRHVVAWLRGKWPGIVLVFSCQSHIMFFTLSWLGPIVIMTLGCLPFRGRWWSCLCVAGLRNWWKRARRVLVDEGFRTRTNRTWYQA